MFWCIGAGWIEQRRKPLWPTRPRIQHDRLDVAALLSAFKTATFVDQPGRFLPAEVRDPAFDQTPNIYTQALANDTELRVRATPTYRGEELYRLYIMGSGIA